MFPEVHTLRCYVSVEEGFKRRRSKTPMFLTQGRDQLSSPMSLTMSSSEMNGDYELLMMLTISTEHSQAHLTV